MPGEQGGPRGFRMVEGESAPQPDLGFATLVLSLQNSALVHLGVAPAPDAAEPGPVDLELARQTIDILELLRVKTRGNLDETEARLLEQVLHDLHMRFLAAKGR